MNNKKNNWGVSYVYIKWFENALKNHGNISRVIRRDDIIFEITRKHGVELTVICLDEYVLGVSAVLRVFNEFPDVNFISVGGNWNGYTREAKELCLGKRIGLYNSSELTGALWKDDFWSYHKLDNKGNPEYPYRVSGVG